MVYKSDVEVRINVVCDEVFIVLINFDVHSWPEQSVTSLTDTFIGSTTAQCGFYVAQSNVAVWL